MRIDALMFDYDGTLTTERHTIPHTLQQTIAALQANGYICTLNTGTPYPMLSVKVGEQFIPNAPMILEVGGRIVSPDGANRYVMAFSTEEVEAIASVVGRTDIRLMAFTPVDGTKFYVYTSDVTRLQEKYRNQFPFDWIYTDHRTWYDTLSQTGTVRVALEGAGEAFQVPEHMDFPGNVLRNGSVYELTSYGVHKGEAIHRWAAMERIDLSRIAIFGDNFNDVDMFRQNVGMKVQVGNACPELTPYATHQVKDAEELDTLLRHMFMSE